MKTKATIAMMITLGLAMAEAAYAGDIQFSPGEIIHPAPSDGSAASSNGIPLGKSHFKLDGLLLEGILPRDHPKDRSLAQKFLDLPMVNLIVRKSPPAPSYAGSYFAWKGESAQPWVSVSARAGNPDPFSTVPGDGPTRGLLSLSF